MASLKAAAEPTQGASFEEHRPTAARGRIPWTTAADRVFDLAVPRTIVYSFGHAAVVALSHMLAYWMLQLAASRWDLDWLDPYGAFEAVASWKILNIMEATAYLLYLLRALITVVLALFPFRRRWESVLWGQNMLAVYQWLTGAIAPIPPAVLPVLDVALVFAVGMIGVGAPLVGAYGWLYSRHAVAVSALAMMWYAVFRVLVWMLCSSRRRTVQIEGGQPRDEEDEGEEEKEEDISESDTNHRAEQHCAVLLEDAYTMISSVFGLSLCAYSLYFQGHLILLTVTPAHWPVDFQESFQAASLWNTLRTVGLGGSFVLTPCASACVFPALFTLDEIAAAVGTGTIRTINQRPAQNTKPISPAIWLALGAVLPVAVGPIGVWLGQLWPSGDPGMDVWYVNIVGFVAFAFLVTACALAVIVISTAVIAVFLFMEGAKRIRRMEIK